MSAYGDYDTEDRFLRDYERKVDAENEHLDAQELERLERLYERGPIFACKDPEAMWIADMEEVLQQERERLTSEFGEAAA